MMQPGPQLLCGIFSKEDNYAKRLVKQIQFLADVYKEYLTLIQERQWWIKPKENVIILCFGRLCPDTFLGSW